MLRKVLNPLAEQKLRARNKNGNLEIWLRDLSLGCSKFLLELSSVPRTLLRELWDSRPRGPCLNPPSWYADHQATARLLRPATQGPGPCTHVVSFNPVLRKINAEGLSHLLKAVQISGGKA